MSKPFDLPHLHSLSCIKDYVMDHKVPPLLAECWETALTKPPHAVFHSVCAAIQTDTCLSHTACLEKCVNVQDREHERLSLKVCAKRYSMCV